MSQKVPHVTFLWDSDTVFVEYELLFFLENHTALLPSSDSVVIGTRRIPVIIGKNMYLAEAERMHSNGTLEIWLHGHGNEIILNLIKHRKTRVISAIFKGTPTEVTQYRRNTVVRGITIWDPLCSPPLHHFFLYIYNLFSAKGSTRWRHTQPEV